MPPTFSGRSRECVLEEDRVVLRDLVMHLHHRRSAMALPYLPGGKRTDVHPVFEADRGAEGWGCRLVAQLRCSANEYRRREGIRVLESEAGVLRMLESIASEYQVKYGSVKDFELLAALLELELPTPTATRRSATGKASAAEGGDENEAPANHPVRSPAGRSPLQLRTGATTQVPVARTRSALEAEGVLAECLGGIASLQTGALLELGRQLTSEQLAALLTGKLEVEGHAAAINSHLDEGARSVLRCATTRTRSYLAAPAPPCAAAIEAQAYR